MQVAIVAGMHAGAGIGWTPGWEDELLARIEAGASHGLVTLQIENGLRHRLPGLAGRTPIRLDHLAVGTRLAHAKLQLTHHLLRMLREDGKPARLFLSHAKSDGRAMAAALKAGIEKSPAKTFFDEVDLVPEEEFENGLAGKIRESIVIAILTNRFSSRSWCQWEILNSKLHDRPLLVVDALTEGEPRSFPYLANAPTLRWDPADLADEAKHMHVVGAALREGLRFEFVGKVVRALKDAGHLDAGVQSFPRPPELLTSPKSAPASVVYPDPPLSKFELDPLYARTPGLRAQSFTQALANIGGSTLRGKTIALSISESPAEELRIRGLGKPAHLDRAWVAFAEHLLAAGARIAYGGDLRQSGYTEHLIDVVRAHADSGDALPDHVVANYIPWPASLKLQDPASLAKIPKAIDAIAAALPAGFPLDPKRPADPDTPLGIAAWTIALTEMRRQMARKCDARVLLGGRHVGVGLWPGLAEEARCHLEAGKPVYLVGGFGGATTAIIEALLGRPSPTLDRDHQLGGEANTSRLRRETAACLEENPSWGNGAPDYEGLIAFFAGRGITGLGNGLSEAENRHLFTTLDPLEQVALVLRGLARRLGEKG
jgi:hypothetical protein